VSGCLQALESASRFRVYYHVPLGGIFGHALARDMVDLVIWPLAAVWVSLTSSSVRVLVLGVEMWMTRRVASGQHMIGWMAVSNGGLSALWFSVQSDLLGDRQKKVRAEALVMYLPSW